jgi:DNA-binding PadR family transcriptional regulator
MPTVVPLCAESERADSNRHTTPAIVDADVVTQYIATRHMPTNYLSRELKRGSAELLIMALLEERERHGYEIARLIVDRSKGAISFQVASLYPTLYRLEDKGLLEGRWVEKAGQRRRRYYRLTAEGRKVLASQRSIWQNFFLGLDRVARIRHA